MKLPSSPIKESAANSIAPRQQSTVTPSQPQKVGLLVTNELDKAIERCKKKVEAISRDCPKRNRKFRDLAFDLEEDKERCLHGLSKPPSFSPSDVLRVSQIFDKPEFFIDGVSQSDIVQGELGDCWFLSALATVSTVPFLVEKFCVARDEKVGVYGFIFYRDSGWVDVVIDDLLFVTVPKYESLTSREKTLYHDDKDLYNLTARKGGKCLSFARGGTDNETWVPLVEKAYAKLHGDYASLSGGAAAEALEDLTGGVSTLIHMNDILDRDVFWEQELLRANEDRLFGCYLSGIETPPDADDDSVPTVKGLVVGHAYSVLKAIEYKGKRFVRLRNPWGRSEWTGPWSDGSKEWNEEWLAALPYLQHSFGDDGEFLMAFEDFISTFWVVHRTKLFDGSWTLSSHWLEVIGRKFPGAWNFGDVSFTFSMPKASPVIIVLAQIDSRYFKDISGYAKWSFDFALFKRGEKDVIAVSQHTAIWSRSVNIEEELEAGDYVVHVRFDRRQERRKNYLSESVGEWNARKLAKVMSEACFSQSVAANFNPNDWGHHQLPIPLERYAGHDLTELEVQAIAAAVTKVSNTEEQQIKLADSEINKNEAIPEESNKDGIAEESENDEKAWKDVEEEDGKPSQDENDDKGEEADGEEEPNSGENEDEATGDETSPGPVHDIFCDNCKAPQMIGMRYKCLDALCRDFDLCEKCFNKGAEIGTHKATHRMVPLRPEDASQVFDPLVEGDDNSVIVGLRVFTKDCQDTPVVIQGQLRHGKIISWARPEDDA